MHIKTVGLVSPGEMGHNIALVLGRHGLRVVSCLEGRSQRTLRLADVAGISSLPSFDDMVTASELILSVVVPSAAHEVGQAVAKAIASTGRKVLFADANAISPMTSIAIGDDINKAGGKYVDVSIIGSAARLEKGATFYASGEHAREFALLQNYGLKVQILGDKIGQASAFKIVYAGLTKGLTSLTLELLLTARALGILDQILEKYHLSYPEITKFIEQIIPGIPPRATRRSQEMEELSDTMEHAGLTPIMARASGDLLKRIGELSSGFGKSEEENRLSLKDTIEKLYQILHMKGKV